MTKEKRSKYCHNWEYISYDIRQNRARNKCEKCGVSNGAIVYKDIHNKRQEATFEHLSEVQKLTESTGKNEQSVLKMLRMTKIILTVAHLNQNTSDNDYFNLQALCQKCHFFHDRLSNLEKRLILKHLKRRCSL